MATARVGRSLLAGAQRSTSTRIAAQSRRRFIPGLASDSQPQSLIAHRTVPYPASAIFEIVSDVASYASFLPFCRSSEVTRHSKPHPDTKHAYPEEATLTIGFDSNISESFTSRVYCVPNTTVEAISGPLIEPSLPGSAIGHHNPRPSPSSDPSRGGAVLTHLRTTWTLRPFPFKPGPLKSHQNPVEETSPVPAQEQTEVVLEIEYKFANPVYGAMSKAAAPKVAEYMVEAFEKRIQDVLHRPAAGAKTGVIKPSRS